MKNSRLIFPALVGCATLAFSLINRHLDNIDADVNRLSSNFDARRIPYLADDGKECLIPWVLRDKISAQSI